ncbi:protein jag [Candidatus Shapirobacteria bacterium CG10_big_fil_rev_8_21_14_0_10_38_14]|uniref:Protein jag n=1 Tax=Candidatus Shapirobacteria bacterium CG10_big_fil_rev_8_21_14_0_10_38_14 TaxID=1974483 RepID=A0A2M8L691_9BACT|nr:MAG: protein jag [Candidatus Shapirobacteria bacterium CG10_big_fil_rev_8_21_14_0_10_38_14]
MAEKDKKIKKGNKVETVKNLAQKLLDWLGVVADFKIEETEESLNLNLQTDQSALLIGFHGETLTAFQLILSMMIYQKLGEWVRISIDVDGYRQRRYQALEQMALSTAQKVRFSKKPCALPSMSAHERRIVHLALADSSDIQTESQGEEPERKVVISPK